MKAIFLDRDGTINVDTGYPHKLEDLAFEAHAIEGLALLSQTSYNLIIITTQSVIARGYYTEKDMHAFNQEILRQLKHIGITITDIYFCPHHPTKGKGSYLKDCECRKPKIGMLMQAAAEHNIDLNQSIVIGDKTADIQMGVNAGCRTILVNTGKKGEDKGYDVNPTYSAQDLLDAAQWIKKQP